MFMISLLVILLDNRKDFRKRGACIQAVNGMSFGSFVVLQITLQFRDIVQYPLLVGIDKYVGDLLGYAKNAKQIPR